MLDLCIPITALEAAVLLAFYGGIAIVLWGLLKLFLLLKRILLRNEDREPFTLEAPVTAEVKAEASVTLVDLQRRVNELEEQIRVLRWQDQSHAVDVATNHSDMGEDLWNDQISMYEVESSSEEDEKQEPGAWLWSPD